MHFINAQRGANSSPAYRGWLPHRFRRYDSLSDSETFPAKLVAAAGLFWAAVVCVQFAVPAWTGDLQWIATVLWCVETFPQLWLNARRADSSGQALGTVAISTCGKTTDMLAAFL